MYDYTLSTNGIASKVITCTVDAVHVEHQWVILSLGLLSLSWYDCPGLLLTAVHPCCHSNSHGHYSSDWGILQEVKECAWLLSPSYINLIIYNCPALNQPYPLSISIPYFLAYIAVSSVVITTAMYCSYEGDYCLELHCNCTQECEISIFNHIPPSTIRAVIGTLTCMSMACNSTSDSECYQAVQVQVRVLLLP